MPKDASIKSVLIIGSGPIIIGQAAEFDYSGTQAARSLREEGVKVISGGVKGLYTIMESILVIDSHGGIWGAFIDPEDNFVRYFSNSVYTLNTIPEQAKEWISRFPNPEKL